MGYNYNFLTFLAKERLLRIAFFKDLRKERVLFDLEPCLREDFFAERLSLVTLFLAARNDLRKVFGDFLWERERCIVFKYYKEKKNKKNYILTPDFLHIALALYL